MTDYETTIRGIDLKVRQLIQQNERLKEKVLQLTEQNEKTTEYNNQLKESINQLTEEIKIIKLRNTIAQKGDSAEIKLKINQLIRNIDKSLELLAKID